MLPFYYHHPCYILNKLLETQVSISGVGVLMLHGEDASGKERNECLY